MSNQLIFQAAADGNLEIHVNDEIGFWGVTANDVIAQIRSSNPSSVTVRINSVGGDVNDALSIYNYLKDSGIHVTTKVDGMAASAATIIMQAAGPGNRQVADSSMIMTHEASVTARGKKHELEAMSEALDVANAAIKAIYIANGVSEEIADSLLFGGDHWQTPQEAIDNGLADKTFNGTKEATATAYRIAASAKGLVPDNIKDQFKNEDMSDQSKPAFNFMDWVKSFKNDVTPNDFQNKVTEIEAAHKLELEANASTIEALNAEKSGFEASITELTAQKEAIEVEKSTLEAKVATFEAKPTPEVKSEGDAGAPPIQVEDVVLTPGQKIIQQVMNGASSDEKLMAKFS